MTQPRFKIGLRSILFAGLLWLCPFLHQYTLQAQTPPVGFSVDDVFPTTTFTIPVQVVFFPDGRKFVVEKGGVVWMATAANVKLPTPFIDLSAKVLSNFDKGLLGVALDPDFATNRWVYFLYVVDPDSNGDDSNTSSFSRCERYKADSLNPNVANLASRQILIGGSWSTGIPYPAVDGSHAIGTLRFGRDKTLLIGNGDAAHFGTTDAGGLDGGAFGAGKTDPTQNIGAFRAQSLNSFNGKILRVDKETGLGLPSNPYWDGNSNSVRSRVWVYGLRNPFRFAIRPGSGSTVPGDSLPGTLYIGDVGWNTLEKLNIAKKGRINFGWPCIEGGSAQGSYQAVSSTTSPNANVLCGAPLNSENPTAKSLPAMWWHHNTGSASNPVGWVGSCAIGGAFYSGTSYPTRYRNSVFVADYAANWIRSVQVDVNDNVINGGDTLFITNAQGPVCIEADPISGDLFYIGINTAKVYRIRYTIGNQNPVAIASAFPTSGLTPLTITATASASNDPDGDPLTFLWTFGDGGTAHTADTTYTYTTEGTFDATVTVSDNRGGSAQASFQIVSGQIAPGASIINPPNQSFFIQNQVVILQAADADTTAGPVTYQWDIDLYHDTHHHPSQFILSGQNNSFVASTPDDGQRYFWRVRLGVTRGSLTSKDTADVLPRLNLTPVSVSSSPAAPPSGSQFQVMTKIRSAGDVGTSPGTLQVLEGLTVLGTGSIGSIANGDSAIVVANVGPLTAGPHTLRIVIDSQNDVYETNESDNEINTVVTIGPPGQDITSQSTAIALITAPQGSGNPSLAVIKDGVFPAVGSGNTQQQYDTWNGGALRAFDWIGHQFPSAHTFVGLTFQEGMQFFDGGWFNTLQVEVLVGGVWIPAQNLVTTPAYLGNNAVNYETFNLSFVPITGTGIRISGAPGGSAYFMSVGELRVLVNDGPPVVSTVTVTAPNGGQSWSAGTNQNITWTSSNVTTVNLSYKTSAAGAWISIAQNLPAAGGTYTWTIPNAPTTQARVRIVNSANSANVDSSDANFTIVGIPALTVVSPNGGETWAINASRPITWSFVNVANVDLFYKTSAAGPWIPIAQNLPAAGGSYAWTVPNAPTTQARVKIVDSQNGTPVDSSDANFTLTNAPQDITSQGTAIAFITAPQGGGNHSLTVISDGVFPAVGSGNNQQQYDTWAGGTVRALDWIGYQFPATHTYVGLTFQEGMHFGDGGWFTSLSVQVRVSGVWTNVTGLVSTPAYPGNNGVNYETFNLSFTGMTGDAVRISGPPGGTGYFISVGELRALVNDGPPPVGTATLVSPNGGETFSAGSIQNITWNSANVTLVNLSYKTSAAGAWTSIATNVAAAGGTFAWTVPATATTQARVRIINAQSTTPVDSSDSDFTIIVPTVTLATPNGGEGWLAGSVQNITWSSTNTTLVNLSYKTTTAGSWTSIATNVAAAGGTFAWTVPNTPTAQARVRVVNAQSAIVVDSSDANFTILGIPAVTVLAPNGGEVWQTNASRTITWSVVNVANVDLYYKTVVAGPWIVIAQNLPAAGGSYAWTVPNAPTTQARVKIVDSQNGTPVDSSDANFTLTNAPQDITSQGTAIAFITAPQGGGNHSLTVISDGVFPAVGSGNNQQQYDTWAGGTVRALDWIGYQFPATHTYVGLTFQEGMHFGDGGWFTSLSVQVRVSGVWTNVTGLVSTPAYPGNNGVNYETFNLSFTGMTGDAVRISGPPGGTGYFISVGELRALVNDGPPPVGTATLVSPNGGETFSAGSIQNITWNSANVTLVNLSYKTSAAGAWTSIATNVAAAGGTFAWTVPATATTQARVRIINAQSTTPVDSSDSDFTIIVPTVTLATPNGGEGWLAGSVQNITWSSTNTTLVNLSYKTTTAGSWTSIATNVAAAGGTFAWTVPNTPTAQARVRVVNAQSAIVVDSSDANFTILGIPAVTVLAPNGGESWPISASRTITWSVVNVANVDLYYKTVVAGPWIVIAQNISGATGSYAWTVPNAQTTQARIKIVNSAGGSPVDSSDSDFTITNSVLPQDITALGTAVALITAPGGSGNHSLSVIKDGVFPAVGSGNTQQQYDTWNGGGARATDWIGYTFAAPHTFSGVTFQEGMHFGDGGWFTTLQVQARNSGVWTTVPGFVSTPAYPGNNNGVNYETFNLTFTATSGDGIRISGTPGGSGRFISVGELRSIANEPPATSITATVTDGVTLIGWPKLQETKVAGFEILKSADRQGDFRSITADLVVGQPVEGKYGYTDRGSEAGTWYYKVKQVDVDGAMHYSDCVEADVLAVVGENEPLPVEFSLEQNYPNPFNPVTAIEFALPKESRVKLEVYNVLGQRVRTLVDEIRQSGRYSEQFDASGIASGVYFYRIQAHPVDAGKSGGFVAMKKLVLLK